MLKIFFKNISDAKSRQHKISCNSKLGKIVSFGWWLEGIRHQRERRDRSDGISS